MVRLSILRQVYWDVHKGRKKPLYKPFKYFNYAEPEKYGGTKPIHYFKNMMNDAPELFISAIMGVATLGGLIFLWNREANTGHGAHSPYKRNFIVVRPDDPLANTARLNPAYYDEPMKEPTYEPPRREKRQNPYYWPTTPNN